MLAHIAPLTLNVVAALAVRQIAFTARTAAAAAVKVSATAPLVEMLTQSALAAVIV